ncbi:hypothetical protein [Thiomicrorhabdus indica]|uniref:hypothetical protein n=1 Tax=Thiomicrorhabdus indica TaxID=2267253 RepID=UPI00102D9D98|nr:hypothetical protein [Thiomicrorhabdus indica]
MYIKRDTDHKIAAISLEQLPEFDEILDDNAEEIFEFLKRSPQIARHPYIMKTLDTLEKAKESLAKSDEEFIRVLEDVIDLLTEKGFIQFTELPEKAQEKLMTRQTIRAKTNKLDLVEEEDDSLSLP